MKKPATIRRAINEALFMFESFGVPLKDSTPRRLERMALCFMALAQVNQAGKWKTAKGLNDKISMRSRDIIAYINQNLSDSISPGSYDDIRRQDLKLLVLAGVVAKTRPDSATNDAMRGYALSPAYSSLVRDFGSSDWEKKLKAFMQGRDTLSSKLSEDRTIQKIPVVLTNKSKLYLTLGEHNLLQKAIIEEFLPRFGQGAEVLYLGDTTNKQLFKQAAKLKTLGFPKLSHDELPDVIAYSKSKNWIFLIEAVNSYGAISPTRKLKLEVLAKDCKAGIVFVTAFPDKAIFRKFISEIAWETEVWVAQSPDHLVHFNGDKLMGPHKA